MCFMVQVMPFCLCLDSKNLCLDLRGAQQSLVMHLPGVPMVSSICVNVSAAGGQHVGHPSSHGPSQAFLEASSVSSTVSLALSHLG